MTNDPIIEGKLTDNGAEVAPNDLVKLAAEVAALRAAVARVRELCTAPAADRVEIHASWHHAILRALDGEA